MIVAVNKLDTVDWSKDRFDEISNNLKVFLQKHAGFTNIVFVPVSGLTGVNLATNVGKEHPLFWYKGPTLIEALG